MNRLTLFQRKLVYGLGILLLLIPIIWLGMPATAQDPSSGGRLARLRQRYDLGETSLGDVDPSSATMNLVLLGLRGLAVNLLWMEHDHLKQTKNWPEMRATTESIILLQPHYLHVWRYHGWDLAYNVSAEWDGVADRYYWVKEGAKFTMRGTLQNQNSSELFWDVGNILGKKVGRSDEWKQFREYFLDDPQLANGGPDPDINPEGDDNYLVAKDWFITANEKELAREQHIMARPLFRSYPARSQLDYAGTLQREGVFGEKTGLAWQEGFEDWTNKFGQEMFETPGGQIKLEMTTADLARLSDGDEAKSALLGHWAERYQDMSNYRYWRTRALAESEDVTEEAHRELYDGGIAFRNNDLAKSEELTLDGLEKFATVFERYPNLASEDEMIEEVLTGILTLQYIHQLRAVEPPEDYPLKWLADKEKGRMPELDQDFRRRYRL